MAEYMKKIINNNLVRLAIVLLPIATLFLVYVYLTPLYHDDYSYFYSYYDGSRISSVSDVFLSQYGHYFAMNGRVVTHTIAQLFLLMGKPIFNIVNTVAFICFGVLIYIHAFGTIKRVKMLPLAFCFISLFLFSPAFGESFLWLIGASNYLYGIIIVLLFLLPYRMCIDKTEKPNILKNIFSCTGMLIFGFIAGATNENNSIALIFMVIMYLIYRIVKYRNAQIWSVSGMVGSVLGCLFMMLSPAQLNRLGVSSGLSNILSFSYIRTVIVSTIQLIRESSMLLLIIAILLSVYFIMLKKENNNSLVKNIIDLIKNHFLMFMYLFGFLISFYSMTVSPYFPERTWSGPLSFLIVFTLIIYDMATKNIDINNNKTINILVGSVLIIIAFSVYFHNFFELKNCYNDYNDRTNLIYEQISEGNTDLVIPSIYCNSKYSCYNNDGDLSSNSEHWTNTQLARYYGVERVILQE